MVILRLIRKRRLHINIINSILFLFSIVSFALDLTREIVVISDSIPHSSIRPLAKFRYCVSNIFVFVIESNWLL